ncbi:MAG: hypothetical protein IT374_01605 [Polyangiaceae bacterium]|nr:hypothetical protein [Polyangiaceae bacterium]
MSARAFWVLLVAVVGCASGAGEPSGPPGDDFGGEDFGGAAGAGGDAGGAGEAGASGAGAGGASAGSGGASKAGASGSGGTAGAPKGGASGASSGGKGGASAGGSAGAAGKASGGAAGGGAAGGGAAGKAGGGAAGGGAAGGGAGGASGAGGGGGCAHASANCAAAEALSQISGDQGSDSLIRSGTNGAAFTVLVAETSSNVIPADPKVKATLTVPAGMEYALDVSWIPGGTCPGTVLGPKGQTSWSTSWNDSFGGDDSRLLLFEVKYVSGDLCGDASKWTLTIEGNK